MGGAAAEVGEGPGPRGGAREGACVAEPPSHKEAQALPDAAAGPHQRVRWAPNSRALPAEKRGLRCPRIKAPRGRWGVLGFSLSLLCSRVFKQNS